jgi:enoyl-CoA hydratase/carnithine racemase
LAATFEEAKRTAGRLLLLPAYSVAAINGHAFALGAILSCAFDYRVMRVDRGYWCMNEVEIGLALDEGLWSIMRHRLPSATATNAALTAHRYGAPEALEAGIVDATAAESEVLSHAIDVAESYAHLDRKILARHKVLAHGDEAAYLGFSK